MDADKLDRRVTIQRKTVSLSSSGEPSEAWSSIAVRCPASMWPVKGDERFGNPQEVATDQIEFKVRYSIDVMGLTPLDRIIHPALEINEDPENAPTRYIHDILSVQEIGRRDGLKIITLRRADVLTVEPAPPTGDPSLDFSDSANSMYLALLMGRVAIGPVAFTPSLDFSQASNSGYLALLAGRSAVSP